MSPVSQICSVLNGWMASSPVFIGERHLLDFYCIDECEKHFCLSHCVKNWPSDDWLLLSFSEPNTHTRYNYCFNQGTRNTFHNKNKKKSN